MLTGGRLPAVARVGGREVLLGHGSGRVEPSESRGRYHDGRAAVVAMKLRLRCRAEAEGVRETEGIRALTNSSAQPRHETRVSAGLPSKRVSRGIKKN